MSMRIDKSTAIFQLRTLLGYTLSETLKSPDTELYEFVFEKPSESRAQKMNNTYLIHALCSFKVMWRLGEKRVVRFYGDTSITEFQSKIQCLHGHEVKRIDLSDKHDLWIDFGDYWVVFVTDESDEESWRFFKWRSPQLPHMVASNAWFELVY